MNTQGLIDVGSSDTAAGAVTWIGSKISTENSEINPDNTKSEDTTGSVYGGSVLGFSIAFFEDDEYPTHETMMLNNIEKFWHFKYQDGRVLTTAIAMNIFVKPATGVDARQGVAPWMMDNAEKYNNTPIL